VKNTSIQPGNISGKWFEDGHSSVRAASIDRHILTGADETAIIWETGDPKTPAEHITYRELL
jgi:acetyl-CoA synthetase